MCIKTENGELRNLNYAHKITKFQRYNKVYVQATFSVAMGKNFAAPAFSEVSMLKIFNNENDAKSYMDMICDVLNGKKPLSYAFIWLKNKSVEGKGGFSMRSLMETYAEYLLKLCAIRLSDEVQIT